jgi:hypothetical protein
MIALTPCLGGITSAISELKLEGLAIAARRSCSRCSVQPPSRNLAASSRRQATACGSTGAACGHLCAPCGRALEHASVRPPDGRPSTARSTPMSSMLSAPAIIPWIRLMTLRPGNAAPGPLGQPHRRRSPAPAYTKTIRQRGSQQQPGAADQPRLVQLNLYLIEPPRTSPVRPPRPAPYE